MKKDYEAPEAKLVSFDMAKDLLSEPIIDPSIIPVPDD